MSASEDDNPILEYLEHREQSETHIKHFSNLLSRMVNQWIGMIDIIILLNNPDLNRRAMIFGECMKELQEVFELIVISRSRSIVAVSKMAAWIEKNFTYTPKL